MIEYEIEKHRTSCKITGWAEDLLVSITRYQDNEFQVCRVFSEINLDRDEVIAEFRPKRKT